MSEKETDKTVVNVNPPGDSMEITHLHGSAPDPINPKSFNISGDIFAPATFFEKRLKQEKIDLTTAYVVVNRHKASIELILDPTTPISGTVKGQMKMNPVLESWNINNFGGHKFSEDEFVIALKKGRSLFQSQAICLNMIDSIKNLEIQVNQQIDKRDDERANRKMLFEQTAASNLPEAFTISVAVFDGTIAEDIEIELKYSFSQGQLYFWLESPGLQLLIEEQRDELIDKQVLRFGEDIPIIYN